MNTSGTWVDGSKSTPANGLPSIDVSYLLAASDVATQVACWARAQGDYILTVDNHEENLAIHAHIATQRAIILRALFEIDDPRAWANEIGRGTKHPPSPSSALVGTVLTNLVSELRAIAIALGWEPQRETISSRVRTLVYRRDGYACVECAEDDITRLSIDHRIPVTLGGSNDTENLRTLCKRCNSSKGARL